MIINSIIETRFSRE